MTDQLNAVNEARAREGLEPLTMDQWLASGGEGKLPKNNDGFVIAGGFAVLAGLLSPVWLEAIFGP